MFPKLFAFDLDGTLLNNKKELSINNIIALKEMSQTGSIIALASGRIGSSMQQYVNMIDNKVALLTLNGAVVYKDAFDSSSLIYNSPLPAEFADYLTQYAQKKNFGINYYIDGKLYGLKQTDNSQWYELYFKQTLSEYSFVLNFNQFAGKSPSKIIFVGDPEELDEIEKYFRSLWADSIYICRTWDYYLEFLNVNANKGRGIRALANSYNINISDVVAFGDAPNDIPMLQSVGLGIAMKNAEPEVKSVAKRISCYTNDEDGIACEWNLIKKEFFA
jgi:Cof subfamily protein (haloacid dehalogenase superfamily)